MFTHFLLFTSTTTSPSSKITILPSSFPFTWHSVMDPTCNPNQTSITRCGTRFLLVSVIHVSPPLPKNQITKTPSLRFLLVRPQPPLFSHSNEGDLCNFKPRNDKKILKLKKKRTRRKNLNGERKKNRPVKRVRYFLYKPRNHTLCSPHICILSLSLLSASLSRSSSKLTHTK